MEVIFKIKVPKFLGKYILKKRGFIKCPTCERMTNPGKYCEWCGASLVKE